jgi:hypothetical protein
MPISWLSNALLALALLVLPLWITSFYYLHDSKTIWLEFSSGTSALALLVGITQLISLRHNAKVRETLSACERYDSDGVITQCLRSLKQGEDSGEIALKPTAYSLDLITILNYFEGIAIGISQGLYDKKVAKDHLEPIIAYYVDKYMSSEAQRHFSIDAPSDYNRLIALHNEWRASPKPQPTHYRA